ncbi:ABC transporter permease [Parapedobacter koreensis]|uniref:ABC-type antimicrobial peptide transport system, permease component n=1 Tax=Parapedobacter koreensis TaxID=332977 RepID=A0A1H7R2Y0_9SPHI|nr:ABC transporter permease [Parapedobacter koreensis]SEL54522.1 ABC-type antimicrobial peptide transport system, permease component [Parapedobacter koreensis]
MTTNNFKIAWRNLGKRKGFSILNIAGLALGLASALLILLWVKHERSVDGFHTKGDRLYVAMNRGMLNNELRCWPNTPKPLGPALVADYPEIAQVTRYSGTGFLFTVEETQANAGGAFVDSTFLSMFDFPLVAGNPMMALSHANDIVITEALAMRLFGKTDVLGQQVRIDSADYATVSGVLKNLPTNTRFKFDYLLPWTYMERIGWSDDLWHNNSVTTYVELAAQVQLARVNQNIQNVSIKNGDTKFEIFLHSFPDWWLHSEFENGHLAGGRIEMVQLFTAIAVFILLIACINFMNLSTARSEKRAKEVGVRKVVGARRHVLIGQFLTESILLASLAGMLSVAIVLVSLPAFGEFVGIQLAIDFSSVPLWAGILGVILFTGILSGSYPAFFLSGFKPVKVLKGTFKGFNKAVNPRKALVVLQFTIAIILMVATFIIRQQIQHAQDRQNGYDKNNLIYVFLSGDIAKNFSLIKHALLNDNVATSITRSISPVTSIWSNGMIYWDGKAPDNSQTFDRLHVDEGAVTTLGMELVQGRDLDLTKFPTDSNAALITESAQHAMGFDDPIGKTIRDHEQDWHIVGVVKDVIMGSPFERIRPIVMYGASSWFSIMHIKFNPDLPTQAALDKTRQILKAYNPNEPFNYSFIDQEYAAKFSDTQQLGNIAGLFTFLTIFISCLGLFGLAAYMAENRTKEIGVRKVLGASVLSLVNLLNKEFLTLVGIACLVAFPIAYWAMDSWLKKFTYHTDIYWWVFAAIGLGVLLIALLTVSSQAIKAALANPTRSLRDE